MEQYGLECAAVGIFNERAAVLRELDLLAREFDAAGKPNTARRVREVAAKIDSRLRDEWR
jgi:DNA-binding IclR family transcriptional regulator